MLAYKVEMPYIISAELSGEAEMLIRTEDDYDNNLCYISFSNEISYVCNNRQSGATHSR